MRAPAPIVAGLLCLGVAAGCGEDPTGASSGSSGTGADEALTSDGRTSNPLRHSATRLNGREEKLAKYKGSVVLVVNTATDCGFTPQFDGLQSLYDEYRRDGFVVLGFPSNDFAGQEPRSDKEIGRFCRANYGVRFPMFSKTEVTGEDAHPLFKDLGAPGWNFNKYLLDRNGTLVKRWGAGTDPDDQALEGPVSRLL